MSTQTSCTFKMEPAPVFLFAYISACVLCSALVAGLALTSPAFSGAKLPVVLETIGYVIVFFGPPYAALSALVMTHYFKYTATAEGIHGQSLLGKPTFVPWTEIAEMRPARIGNLEFVRLISERGARPVWLPTFVRHAAGAPDETEHWAPQFQNLRSLSLAIPRRAHS